VAVVVTNGGDGSFTCKYTPADEAALRISVRVFGQRVPGSPFTVRPCSGVRVSFVLWGGAGGGNDGNGMAGGPGGFAAGTMLLRPGTKLRVVQAMGGWLGNNAMQADTRLPVQRVGAGGKGGKGKTHSGGSGGGGSFVHAIRGNAAQPELLFAAGGGAGAAVSQSSGGFGGAGGGAAGIGPFWSSGAQVVESRAATQRGPGQADGRGGESGSAESAALAADGGGAGGGGLEGSDYGGAGGGGGLYGGAGGLACSHNAGSGGGGGSGFVHADAADALCLCAGVWAAAKSNAQQEPPQTGHAHYGGAAGLPVVSQTGNDGRVVVLGPAGQVLELVAQRDRVCHVTIPMG
jgi:hypothetical protein